MVGVARTARFPRSILVGFLAALPMIVLGGIASLVVPFVTKGDTQVFPLVVCASGLLLLQDVLRRAESFLRPRTDRAGVLEARLGRTFSLCAAMLMVTLVYALVSPSVLTWPFVCAMGGATAGALVTSTWLHVIEFRGRR